MNDDVKRWLFWASLILFGMILFFFVMPGLVDLTSGYSGLKF